MIENTVNLRGGRPKRTTEDATSLLNERKRKALNDVKLKYNELKQRAQGKGIVVKRGIASQLGLDSNVRNLQERKEILVFDKRGLSRLKAIEEYTMRKAAYLGILALNKSITALSVKELKALVHYNKRKDDGAIPSK